MTLDLHFDSWLGDILKKGHKPEMFVFFKSIWHFLIFRYQIQSTLTLRILLLLRTPTNADKSQLPGETHKEMTETNSHYYGLSLLQKCEHFSAPQAQHFSCFFLLL